MAERVRARSTIVGGLGSPARAGALVAFVCALPAIALAQAPGASAEPSQTASGAMPDDSAAPPAESSSAPAKPVVPATGFGWAPKVGRAAPARRGARSKGGSDAIMPGFETMADGSTRLFLELSKPVPYTAKAAPGTLTYVLQGAYVDRANNTNPLVTMHFNTPVIRARLVPHGRDLWFVIDLRANAQPTVAMDAAKDGAAMMRIEFAKGDYLRPGAEDSDDSAAASSPSASASAASSAAPGPAAPPVRRRGPRGHRNASPGSGQPIP